MNVDNVDESIRDQIKEFLNNNFTNTSKYKISAKPNKDGKFEVSSKGDAEIKNENITSLTNGSFIWTNIKGDFICSECGLLTSLEGAPEKVDGNFNCNDCNSLTSLEGAPEKVDGNFNCFNCNSLTSLKGASEEVGDFYCEYCNSLKSLEGAPKEVGGEFYCTDCYKKFSEEDVKKVSNVKGMIKV